MSSRPAPATKTPQLLLDGRPLALGAELGRGGEAVIYGLADGTRRAIKLYHDAASAPSEKLLAMIAQAPDDPGRAAGHVTIAWPEALVEDAAGQVVGFAMPGLDLGRTLPLHQLYHPGSRLRRAPGLDWRYLVRIARNLCRVVAAVHRAGYVIGDLNESNILVSERALVTLVDLDSVQVRAGSKLYRCPVGKAEYTPPELQGRSFRAVTRQPSHDRYGLTVLVFLLLMEGIHPFAGVYRGEGEPPAIEANMAARRSPYLGSALLAPMPTAPPFELLPRDLRELLRRAFKGPAQRRPAAELWERSLARLEASLATCDISPSHLHGAHLGSCPWCDRRDRLGIDTYPDNRLAAPTPGRRPLPDPGPALPSFRGSLAAMMRQLPLTSLLLLVAGLAAGTVAASQLRGLAALRGWGPAPTLALVAGALLLPAAIAIGIVYFRTRASPVVFRTLSLGERLVQAALGATLLALAISLAIGALTGRGSVLGGDWLLLPSLWVIAFFGLWRWRRTRP